ncbi:MAG: hypothetical protein A4E36_00022 [Methanoregulaceae archaeon PtaB.Bin009]|nr:MAG: hypothetical protein A4E36_00022 [Methanoregulaceae archaeon PtaB.Bin009]
MRVFACQWQACKETPALFNGKVPGMPVNVKEGPVAPRHPLREGELKGDVGPVEALQRQADEIDQEIVEGRKVLGMFFLQRANRLVPCLLRDSGLFLQRPDEALPFRKAPRHQEQGAVSLPELYLVHSRVQRNIRVHPLTSVHLSPEYGCRSRKRSVSSGLSSSCAP